MTMLRTLCGVVAFAGLAVGVGSSGSAQVFYEPLAVNTDDARGHYRAAATVPETRHAHEDDGAPASPEQLAYEEGCAARNAYIDSLTYRYLTEHLDHVYCIPHLEAEVQEYMNSIHYEGEDLTPENEYEDDPYGLMAERMPHYFRKSELMRAAIVQADGSRVVAADAVPVAAPKGDRDVAEKPNPDDQPKRIIIIPKGPRPAVPAEKPVPASH